MITAVFDASAVVRALTGSDVAAARLEDVAASRSLAGAPDLLYAEVANALVQYVRAGRLSAAEADEALDYVTALPFESTPCEELAPDALNVAIGCGVSAYDAMYLALAEATDSMLVTADRRLAAATTRAEFVD